MCQHERDAGQRPGTTTAEQDRIHAIERKVRELRNPVLRSTHERCNEILIPHIKRVWQANMQVYGADKVWRQLRREGIDVAHCTVERLMRKCGLRGIVRGKQVRTTMGDATAPCPLDRVNRQFRARSMCLSTTENTLPKPASKGDSHDNVAETINGLYKAELIHRRAPYKTREAVKLTPLE